MKCECPIVLRCCFCFPLRYGLLVFSYVKQILNLLTFALIIFTFHELSSRKNVRGRNFLIPSLYFILTILDIGFTLLFIIGGHTKNYKKMRIFYRYSIFVLCAYAVNFAFVVAHCVYYMLVFPYIMSFMWYISGPLLTTNIVIIVFQIYTMILVRSEFLKLKNNTQFEFVNREAEEMCVANIEFEKGIPDSV